MEKKMRLFVSYYVSSVLQLFQSKCVYNNRTVGGCSVLGFQNFSDTVISCVNDRGVIKVNAMIIIRPRVVRNKTPL